MPDVYGHIGIKVMDDSGEVVSMPLYFKAADTVTLAQVVTAVQDAVETADNIIAAQVMKSVVVFDIALTGSTSPVIGKRIEETALFSVKAVDGFTRNFGVDIPCPQDTVFLESTKKVDFQNAGVQAFIDMLEGTTGSFRYTTASGTPLLEVLNGRQTFRKHRRVANRH